MPRVDWVLLTSLLAFSALAAVALVAYQTGHVLKQVRAFPGLAPGALLGLADVVQQVPVLAAIPAFIFWQGEHAPRDPLFTRLMFAAGWTAYVAAWIGCTIVAARAQRAARGEKWNPRAYYARLANPWFVTPLVAGWAAVALSRVYRPPPDVPDGIDAVCYSLSHAFVTLAISLWHRRGALAGDGVVIPPQVIEAVTRAGGEGALPKIVVYAGRRAGLPEALAVRLRRGSFILLGTELVASYPPEETTAVLLHELGHHRLGHLRRREWTQKVAMIAILLGATFAGYGHVAVFVAALMLTHRFVLLPQWRRQELEADRFAADKSSPQAMAAALVRLHEAEFLPADFGSSRGAMAHPDLNARLTALSVTPARAAD